MNNRSYQAGTADHATAPIVMMSRSEFARLLREQLEALLAENEQGEPKEVFDVSEACQFLKVSRSTLHRLRGDGGLPTRFVGDSPRFLRSELVEWLRARREPSDH